MKHRNNPFDIDTFIHEITAWHNNLVTNIKNELRESFEIELPENSNKEIWSLIQHFYNRTNLLDVTENPLVALYFACEKDKSLRSKDYVRIVAIKVHRGMYFAKGKHGNCAQGKNKYLVSCLDYRDPDKRLFQNIDVKVPKLPYGNERMERQQGLFLYTNQHLLGKNELFDFERYFIGGPSKFELDYCLNGMLSNSPKLKILSMENDSPTNPTLDNPYSISEKNPLTDSTYDYGIIKSFLVKNNPVEKDEYYYPSPENIGKIEQLIRDAFRTLEKAIN